MATIPQKTLNWLWDVLRRTYRDPQRAYSDVVQTLSTYPTFAPRTDVYTFENGTSALLLHLNGTIPVNFRGTLYQFPIAIWISTSYPTESPMVYVTPTEGMVIRPGQHVSGSDGRVYHPYLARWREASERSTIADLLKILTDVFAREPPVMSRQQTLPTQQQPPSQTQLPPPRPPPPIEQRQPPARPFSIVGPNAGPPPPPKDNQEAYGIRPTTPASPDLRRPGRYDAAPPLPDQSPSSRPTSAANSYASQYQHQRSSSLRQSYPPQLPPQQPPYPNQRYSTGGPPAQQYMQQPPPPQPPQYLPQQQQQQQQHPVQAQIRQVSPQQPVQPQQQPRQIPPATQQFQAPQPQSQYQAPQQVHAGFRSAPHQAQPVLQPHPKTKPQEPNLMDDSPFDITLSTRTTNLPTPAIPPNPEKQHLLDTLSSTLLQNLHQQISQSSSALPLLTSQHQALSSAQATLQSELQDLKTFQSQLSSNISALNSTLASADRVISNAKKAKDGKGVPSIDECVIPPTIVARQLYDAVAEQRGYEAAIYALTDGFVRGRMESKVWERKTRECAREEFKRKWLVKRRLAWGLGLDTSVLDRQ